MPGPTPPPCSRSTETGSGSALGSAAAGEEPTFGNGCSAAPGVSEPLTAAGTTVTSRPARSRRRSLSVVPPHTPCTRHCREGVGEARTALDAPGADGPGRSGRLARWGHPSRMLGSMPRQAGSTRCGICGKGQGRAGHRVMARRVRSWGSVPRRRGRSRGLRLAKSADIGPGQSVVNVTVQLTRVIAYPLARFRARRCQAGWSCWSRRRLAAARQAGEQ